MNALFTKGKSRTLNVPRSIKQEALMEVISDRAIQNYIILIGRLHQAGNRQSIDTREKILSILTLINSELETKGK
jgi:hypothetical protein